MLKVALTGGIASGKTALLKFFSKKGIPAIDSDEIVQELYRREEVKERIFALFGTLDKGAIASQVFSFPEKRRALEAILHPMVVEEIDNRAARLPPSTGIVIVELPLLFEAGLEKLFDRVIVVKCSREQQVARLKKQGLSGREAAKRIASQLPIEEKVKKADFVIDNSKGLASALRQAEKILGELHG